MNATASANGEVDATAIERALASFGVCAGHQPLIFGGGPGAATLFAAGVTLAAVATMVRANKLQRT